MSWVASGFVKGLTVSQSGESITRGEKLVLLILADYHNTDTGYANPSINRLAEEGLYDRRQIIRIVESLEEKQFITIQKSVNENNKYFFNGLVAKCHPLSIRPVTKGRSASGKASDILPSEMSPEPLRTNKPKEEQETPPSLFETSPESKNKEQLPEWIPVTEWNNWVEDRKQRKIPVTPGAKNIAINRLEALKKSGEDPAEILREAVLRGWRGVFSVKNAFQSQNKSFQSSIPVLEETEDALSRERRKENARKAGA